MPVLSDNFNLDSDQGFGREVLQDIQIGPSQPNVTVKVDGSDISGGGTSGDTAQAAQEIEEFEAEGGGLLAIAYGEHLIAGHLVVHKFTLGTPNSSFIYIALMEGQGNGGGHGECEAAVAVYYGGEAMGVSPDANTAGYRFYNGFISTGVASGPQQVDVFLTNLAYSGTAYIAVQLGSDVANEEDRPDKVRGRFKGRRTFDFDSTGRRLSSTNTYSVNPARVAADRILSFYEHKFPTDAALALSKLQEKVDWESWKAWADYNAATISWFNGTTTVSIPRFECHVVFTQDLILADALDQICATAGAFWQDDGEKIIFLPPTERDPVHHFNESNCSNLRIEPRDLRERPNYFITEYRDLDDTFLGQSSVEVRRDLLIARTGEIKSNRAMPPMRKSQADRLTERMARLEADNPNIISLVGDETSIHILPGDFVTISHPIPNWQYQRCLVLSVNLSSSESGDTCEITAQQVEDLLYSDTAHGPRQEALTP